MWIFRKQNFFFKNYLNWKKRTVKKLELERRRRRRGRGRRRRRGKNQSNLSSPSTNFPHRFIVASTIEVIEKFYVSSTKEERISENKRFLYIPELPPHAREWRENNLLRTHYASVLVLNEIRNEKKKIDRNLIACDHLKLTIHSTFNHHSVYPKNLLLLNEKKKRYKTFDIKLFIKNSWIKFWFFSIAKILSDLFEEWSSQSIVVKHPQ